MSDILLSTKVKLNVVCLSESVSHCFNFVGFSLGIDPTLYNVSYHTTSSGAQQDNATDVIPKNVPYRNTIKNAQPIYVRLENKADINCFDASMSFNLVVAPLPIPNENPTKLKQCDTDSEIILTHASPVVSTK